MIEAGHEIQDWGQACDSCNSELRDRFDPESLEGISRIARIAGLTPVAYFDETDAKGLKTARAMDVVVKNFYRDNAAVLAEWETARHVERAPRRKKGTPEEPPKSSTPNA
jgi:hypothetical protein